MTCTGSPRYRLSVLPAAASPLSRDLWSGPRRSAALLADLQEVVYLGLDGDVLPVERAGGIGLPTAVRVAGRLPPVAGLVEVVHVLARPKATRELAGNSGDWCVVREANASGL